MKINLILVPYDLGQENVGMGAGPTRYMQAGADRELLDQGFEVKSETIKRDVSNEDDMLKQIANINTNLAKSVKNAIDEGYFPLVLGGNCNNILGILSGVTSSKIGIIYFDAHGDYNTPKISISGFFDGMPLAIATGQCYPNLLTQIGNMSPIPEAYTMHVGARDLDPKERELLENSEVQVVTTDELKEDTQMRILHSALSKLHSQVQEVYLHIDIDVIDPQEAPGVNYRTPNGLSLDEMEKAIKMIAANFRIEAAALTAFNPDNEKDDKTLRTGIHLLTIIAEAVANSTEAIC
ncbi:MAG: arginase family protein [Candidatus Sifarchaeia archaeon]|jgi:arginase